MYGVDDVRILLTNGQVGEPVAPLGVRFGCTLGLRFLSSCPVQSGLHRGHGFPGCCVDYCSLNNTGGWGISRCRARGTGREETRQQHEHQDAASRSSYSFVHVIPLSVLRYTSPAALTASRSSVPLGPTATVLMSASGPRRNQS